MLIDEIYLNPNFSVKYMLADEMFSVQVYYGGECIFNKSKIKCPRESLRNLKELYSAHLLTELEKRNLTHLLTN